MPVTRRPFTRRRVVQTYPSGTLPDPRMRTREQYANPRLRTPEQQAYDRGLMDALGFVWRRTHDHALADAMCDLFPEAPPKGPLRPLTLAKP